MITNNKTTALVGIGITKLILGIIYHLRFMLELRRTQHEKVLDGLIHGQSQFPASLTVVTAIVLLAIGVIAIVSMIFHVGPFG